ncbi:MAG: hypothetical protein N2319_06870 [Candidatus Kapabacteria bacterium]|nr:hypothetical protein [Candidatus Kapabacteria bacterium]
MIRKFIFILSLIIFFSCSSQRKDAIEYNDKIINEQNKIIEKAITFTSSFETRNYNTIDSLRLLLLSQIESSIEEVSKMQAFDGYDSLRLAALDLFNFYKKVYENEFKEITQIITKDSLEITEDDIIRHNILTRKIKNEEIIFDNNFQKTQQSFAKKYNLNINRNEYQDRLNEMRKR